MANPYSVLGVSTTSTDEQVKAAYLDLVEKYSPVNYSQSPLSDLADSKMKEINDAYDAIMAERRVGKTNTTASGEYVPYNNSSGYSSYAGSTDNSGYAPYGGTSSSSADFSYVRSLLNQNNISGAENALLSMGQNLRGAEWNYLMGRVAHAKGWLDEAAKYYKKAASLEPNNMEYRNAADSFASRRSGQYTTNHSPYTSYNSSTNSGCGSCGSGCDLCSSLICADCCCECMGGDLIRCC